MAEPDKRPTPSRGMQAIRVAMADLKDDNEDVPQLRFVMTEAVYLLEQQQLQLAELAQERSAHASAIAQLTAAGERHEREQKKVWRAMTGLRRSFAQSLVRMRRMAKGQANIERGQSEILAAINSPQTMRIVAVSVGAATAMTHFFAWLWSLR